MEKLQKIPDVGTLYLRHNILVLYLEMKEDQLNIVTMEYILSVDS